MDVVRISYAEFACRRPSPKVEPNPVGKRVDSLLQQKLSGKGAVQVHNQGSLQRERGRGRETWTRLSHPSHVQQQAVQSRPRHIISNVDQATAATIDALNKVTEDNYERMLQRILSSVRASPDPLLICGAILRKCYEQDFFIQVYLRIMTDVLQNALSEEQNKLALLNLSEFTLRTVALDLTSSLPRGLGNSSGAGSGYDGFCERVKAKKHLIGRARTTIGLIDRGLVTVSREDFFQSAVTALETFCTKPRTPSVSESALEIPHSELDYDDDHVDIAIECLKEILCRREDRTPSRLQRLSSLLETHIVPACSLMCRFKLQGILGSQAAPVPQLDVGGGWQTMTRPLRQSGERRQAGRKVRL